MRILASVGEGTRTEPEFVTWMAVTVVFIVLLVPGTGCGGDAPFLIELSLFG